MNKQQRAALRRFRRVQDFLTLHPAIGSADELGKQSQVLTEVLQKLSTFDAEADASVRLTRAETQRQAALRAELRDIHMSPISRIARLVYDVPTMERAFFMPKQRADNDALLAAARGMVQAAGKQPDVFIEHGLSKDFVEELRTAIGALADALGARVESQRRRTVATKTVTQLLKVGNTSVQMLDVVVSRRLRQDPELLASWRAVKRLTDAGGVSGGVTPETPTPDIKAA